jgi:antitoxin (DNA-binding transcriptional repressor) of toxin-antitoxin stability system
MKTATVRDLRNNFAKVSRWLEAGENVEITKRGAPYAKIELSAPVPPKKKRKLFDLKEHRAWMKKVYKGKVLKGNGVLLMREGSKW